jgi:hypothetical protein
MVTTTPYPGYIDAKTSFISQKNEKKVLAFFHLTGHTLTWFMPLERDEKTASWPFFLHLTNASDFHQERTLWDNFKN